LSVEALEKSDGCEWDTKKGCVTSALDQELEDIEQLDEGYDIANPINPSNVLNLTNLNNNNSNTKLGRNLFGNDNDSVSKVGTKSMARKKLEASDNVSTTSSLV